MNEVDDSRTDTETGNGTFRGFLLDETDGVPPVCLRAFPGPVHPQILSVIHPLVEMYIEKTPAPILLQSRFAE